MRRVSPRATILVAVTTVLLVAAGVFSFFYFRGRLRSRREKEYRVALQENWDGIQGSASEVAAAMARVDSAPDLGGVTASADEMRERLESARTDSRTDSPPGKYEEIAEKERRAIESLDDYLEMLSGLSSKKSESELEENREVLRNRARKALTDFNDFSSSMPSLDLSIGAEFFEGAGMLANAFQPQDGSPDVEKEEAYRAVKKFMDADLGEFDIDTIWSLLSAGKIRGLDYFGVTKEMLASTWREAWGDDQPIDYYVSPDVSFPDPSTALVKVIVYFENEAPRIENIRLLKESDGWKLDSYPFVGFE